MALNTAKKGARLERKTMRFYAEQGYNCLRSAASKGPFDVIAFDRVKVMFIQVKSNTWPSPAEFDTIRSIPVPPLAQKVVLRWDDRDNVPKVREIV